jgi:2-amino-4-hydroxy-6-hydroxymethyldihydropteridine diphosphokinase
MEQVVLSLGSNIGNRAAYLEQTRLLIAEKVGKIIRKSNVLETEAWGFVSFPFLNQVLILQTHLSPMDLLERIQSIENQLGRNHRRTHIHDKQAYQDRTIDIDILYYGNFHIQTEKLWIPHPQIHCRDFILRCLADIEFKFPEE